MFACAGNGLNDGAMASTDIGPVDIVYLSPDANLPEVIETVERSRSHPEETVERFGRRYTLVHSEPATEGKRTRLVYTDDPAAQRDSPT
jgi:hypothetical protein